MLTSVRTALVGDVKVESWGTGGSRALVFGGNGPLDDSGAVYVVMQSPEDCDEVIKAAAEAKRQMLGGPQPGPVGPPGLSHVLRHRHAALASLALPDRDDDEIAHIDPSGGA